MFSGGVEEFRRRLEVPFAAPKQVQTRPFLLSVWISEKIYALKRLYFSDFSMVSRCVLILDFTSFLSIFIFPWFLFLWISSMNMYVRSSIFCSLPYWVLFYDSDYMFWIRSFFSNLWGLGLRENYSYKRVIENGVKVLNFSQLP